MVESVTTSQDYNIRGHKELVWHWLFCKHIQSFCTLQQGQYTRSISLAAAGAMVSSNIASGFWASQFLALSAQARQKVQTYTTYHLLFP